MPEEQPEQIGAPEPSKPKKARASRKPRSKPPSSALDPGLFGSGAQRCFFPCNREDALVFLGSLFVSAGFFLEDVALAVQPEGVAFLPDGLNIPEQELLSAGRTERFPVLIEVDPAARDRQPHTLCFAEVRRLVFRSQEEANDFRFRAVDEFDTTAIEASVEPSLFDGHGALRFTLRPAEGPGSTRDRAADRLAAGIRDMVSLAQIAPPVRAALLEFVSPEEGAESTGGIRLPGAARALMSPAAAPDVGDKERAITQAFAADAGEGPRPLIQRVAANLAATVVGSDAEAGQASKWAAAAQDAVRGRIELDGDLLSDDGTVPLRAALLAVVTDKPANLQSFLGAPRPSGPRVTLLAAFLIGLKRGILQMPWREKASGAKWISILLRQLATDTEHNPASNLVTVERDELRDTTTVRLLAGGEAVAAWEIPNLGPDDELSRAWLDDLRDAGYDVLRAGRTPYSWVVALAPGLEVEVSHAEADLVRFPVMRYRLDGTRKMRTVKEVAAVLDHEAMFWRRSIGEIEGQFFYCDLPALPSADGRRVITNRLTEVIEKATSAGKPAKSNSKPGTRKPPAKKEIAAGDTGRGVPSAGGDSLTPQA